MSKRWVEREVRAIAHIREVLQKEIANRPQFPEVVGDRRILRFLRGKQGNVEEALKMYRDFLQWRLDNNVDKVRQDILYGGKDSPYDFPYGKLIIDLAPQIVLSANSVDKRGQPLSLEQFDFKPSKVFKAVTLDQYLLFLTYTLEYRAVVLEQISHEREKAYEAAHPNEEDREEGYGFVVMDFTIRDLKGVGLAHLGSEGRTLVAAALKLGLPNYQEYLGNSVMVNVPWVFTTFWFFVKGLLDDFVIAKLTLSGSDYMDTLLEVMEWKYIPKCLGGGFELYNERYNFDLSETGVFWYEGCPPAPVKASNGHTNGHGKALPPVPLTVGGDSPTNGNGSTRSKRELSALHKTSVHFPNTDALSTILEEEEDVSSSSGSRSGKSGKGGLVVTLKESGREVWTSFKRAPVFSTLLLSIVSRLSFIHYDLVLTVGIPAAILCLLLSLVFAPNDELIVEKNSS